MAHLLPQSQLTSTERERGLRLVLYDGVASQAMQTFTGGAFLVAFALQLGASNVQIGLLSAIPTLAKPVRWGSMRSIGRRPTTRWASWRCFCWAAR